MNMPRQIRKIVGWTLIGWGMFLVALLMQAPQVMAQSDQKTPVATGPAWLFDERKIGQDGWTELMDASQQGDLAQVEALLASGAKVEEADQHGVTPLYAAALGGHVKVMELLVTKGANINARIEGGRTPLTGAVWKGHVQAIEFLVKHGAEVNRKRDDGSTALMQAAILGNQEALQLLIANMANVNNQDQDGATALIWAAEAGKEKVVELLLQAGASTQLKTKNNVHALYIAAQNGHQMVVRQLLDKGMNISERGYQGATALHIAAQNGHEMVVRQLLDKGVDVNERAFQGATALLPAAFFGHTTVVHLLLSRGADPNLANENRGQAPLEIAAAEGHVEIARILIEKGANPNQKNLLDMTPLWEASSKGHETIVRLLLDHGADPNVRGLMGGTPLDAASSGGHVGIVKILIEKGAITESDDIFKSTPLSNAAKALGTKALKTLLDQGGAAVNTPSSLALALLEAATGGNAEKVKLLLEKGADPNTRNVWLQTPLIVAAENGYVEAMDLLLAHGADIKAKDRDEQLSATEYALLGKDRIEEELAKYEEEDKRDILDRYNQVVPHLVEAEKARRSRRGITPRLVFVTKTEGCALSTLDPMTGVTTPWRTLKTCPEDMFVSDQPGAVILRTKNKLEVFSSGATTTEAVKPISLPAPDKKGWKPLFQIAGQLADGRLAIGYREQYGKNSDAMWRWTLYAYTQGKWLSVEQKDCLRPSWCLLTPFSGRSVKENLGDEDWLWHPYLRLNPFFTEAGYAEKDNAEKFAKTQPTHHQMYGYHFSKFTVEGKEHLLYYDQSPGPIYQTGERRYHVDEVYLERSGTVPARLSGDFNIGALEGKYFLWTDGLRDEYPQLRLLDIDTGAEPIQGLHMAAWVYWGAAESKNRIADTESQPSPVGQQVSAAKEPHFLDCQKASTRSDFKALKTYYVQHPDEPLPGSCFRLNDKEFLIVVTDTGTSGQGLYYCDLKTKDGSCVEHEDGRYMPGLKVEQEFMGPYGKQYVLFSTNMARGGFMYGGWMALHLAPKANHPRGYVVEDLEDLGDYQDPESGLCGDRIPKGEKATDINREYKIQNEGTDQVVLVFTATVQDCSNMKTTTETRAFTLQGGKFLERK